MSEAMMRAVAAFLDAHGWRPQIIGEAGIYLSGSPNVFVVRVPFRAARPE